MTIYHRLTAIIIPLLLWSCAGRQLDDTYNAATCEDLAVKIERRDSLTQQEYTAMIGQNKAILSYLVEQSKDIAEQPADNRNGSWRQLLADPEYMERFGYMFTLGSALYQAETEGRLDKENEELYRSLDKYNKELAAYTDKN